MRGKNGGEGERRERRRGNMKGGGKRVRKEDRREGRVKVTASVNLW